MKARILDYVALWESRCYPDGIPDEGHARLEAFGMIPSYRRIAFAIMKNDNNLLTLGHARPSCPLYGILKRIELRARGTAHAQMEMFE